MNEPNSLQQSKTTQSETPQLADSDIKYLNDMRWFFLILIVIWLLASTALPIVAFLLTKNPLSFSLSIPLLAPIYILHRITKYIFPKDEDVFRLKELKIQSGAKKQHIQT